MRRPAARVLAFGGIAVALVAVALVALVSGGGSSSAGQSPSSSAATTTVTRQDLVETDAEDGTLGYGDSRTVTNHLSGVVTWLPSDGDTVRSDHRLYAVDGKPVVLMNGRLPAYRQLGSSSTDGADIRQLERDLRADGYDSGHAMTLDDSWDSGTTTAVERWQKAHGLDQTGQIGLGRIVFQPGPRRVASMSATLGGSAAGGGASGGAAAGAGASAAVPASSQSRTQLAAFVRVTSTTTSTTTTPTTTTTTIPTTPTTTTTTTPTTTTKPTKPKTTQPSSSSGTSSSPSSGAARSAPSGGSATGATSGGSGGSGASSSSTGSVANGVLVTTSTRRVVTVPLATTKSTLARIGARVSVELPSGRRIRGRIVGVSKVATAAQSSSSGSSATVTVTIRLSARGAVLDRAPVTVRFEQNRLRNVLTIPVTALLARPGGSFAVEVVDGSARRLVAVTPGLYTSGYVEISGAGLRSGLRVTNAAIR